MLRDLFIDLFIYLSHFCRVSYGCVLGRVDERSPSEKIQNMVARAVLPGTRAQYLASNLSWRKFRLEQHGVEEDVYNNYGSYNSMVLLVLDWMVWLEEIQGHSGSLIGRLITGLTFFVRCQVIHATIFTHPSIIAARKAIAPVQVRRGGHKVVMGLNLDMLQQLRTTLWLSGSLDDQMTYISIATGYNFTMRPGHITYMGPAVNDHRYLVGDLTVEAMVDGTMHSFAEWMASGSDTTPLFEVSIFILRTDTSKTHGRRYGGDGSLNFICPGNTFETEYFEDFQQWLKICGLSRPAIPRRGEVNEGNLPTLERPLFARVHPDTQLFRKSILKDITTALKACASQLGLSRASFTGKSLRIGGTTTAVAAGASSEEITRATGHANVDTSKFYTRSTRHTHTSLGYGPSVGVQDIKRMTVERYK